jgi:hypothetical protein
LLPEGTEITGDPSGEVVETGPVRVDVPIDSLTVRGEQRLCAGLVFSANNAADLGELVSGFEV